MNKKQTTIVAIVLGLVVFGIMALIWQIAYGDDGSKCSTWSVTGAEGWVGDCYTPLIYQQNQVIEKQNEQIIELSAIASCSNFHSMFINSPFANENDINRCVDKLVNETK